MLSMSPMLPSVPTVATPRPMAVPASPSFRVVVRRRIVLSTSPVLPSVPTVATPRPAAVPPSPSFRPVARRCLVLSNVPSVAVGSNGRNAEASGGASRPVDLSSGRPDAKVAKAALRSGKQCSPLRVRKKIRLRLWKRPRSWRPFPHPAPVDEFAVECSETSTDPRGQPSKGPLVLWAPDGPARCRCRGSMCGRS